MFNDERDEIILNENAYFFKRNQVMPLSTNKINTAFKSASVGRLGNYLFNKVKESITIGPKLINYSLCIFKFQKQPSFIKKHIPNWIEIKLAYLLIVEIDDYVVLSKKNISRITDLLKSLSPIDYEILSSVFIETNTSFEQFSLQNMNISNSSVRSKNISSIDLKDNFSPLGANSYVLKNLRLKNNSEKITLALNTSRINKFGVKNGIKDFIVWANLVKEKIVTHNAKESFLSIFATPQDFESLKDTLIPIAILLDVNQILEDFNSGFIQRGIIAIDDIEKELNLNKFLSQFNRLHQINTIVNNGNTYFKIDNTTVNDFYIKKNSKSISLTSKKLRNIKLITSENTEIPILEYINQRNDFIINFEDLEFVYTKRKLFRDSKLLGSISYFLKIFKPFIQLENTISEKGVILNTSSQFGPNSVFDFVENEFKTSFDYLICDDLGREWADHIGINGNTIAFYHSKSKGSNFSASDFQDVIGQAQKNFGNLIPTEIQLQKKEAIWQNYYRGNTQINKLRHGDTIPNAINMWKETILNPNLKREVHIVIDFISKTDLADRLDKLRNGINFSEKNEVIQILWFVSSLISSSQELGIEIYIDCKP